MKKIISICLALSLALSVSACSGGGTGESKNQETKSENTGVSAEGATTGAEKTEEPAGEVKEGGTLNIYLAGDPSSLDYFRERVNEDLGMYQRILTRDETGNFHGQLVESYEADKEKLTYTFHMWDKPIKFHDGSLLTSEVFAWNINQYKEMGYYASSFSRIDSAEAVDDSTFVIHMKEWDMFLPNYLARMCHIVSKEYIDANGWDALAETECGTGPFTLGEWKRGEEIKTLKFADYWEGSPRLDGVNYVIYSSPEVAIMALENGDLDIVDFQKISYSYLDQLKANDSLVIYDAYRGGYAYTLGFNCNKEDEPLNNVKVRMAICSAIDVDAVANVLTEGYYYPGSHQWSVDGYVYCSDKVPGFEYNPEKSKELLAEAGYPEGFSTTVKVQAAYEDAAVLVKEFLQQVGIECEVESLDRANFDKYVGGWDSGMLIHTVGCANGQEYQILNSARSDVTNGYGSGSFIHSEELDRLCDEASNAVLEDSYEPVKKIAEIMFQEDVSMYTMAVSQGIVVASKDVKDAGICEDGSRSILALDKAWLDR